MIHGGRGRVLSRRLQRLTTEYGAHHAIVEHDYLPDCGGDEEQEQVPPPRPPCFAFALRDLVRTTGYAQRLPLYFYIDGPLMFERPAVLRATDHGAGAARDRE